MTYHYTAFGLYIQAAFALPQCTPDPTTSTADVRIGYGHVPALNALQHVRERGVMYAITEDALYYQVRDVAAYRVSQQAARTQVTVHVADDSAETLASVRAFLLGPVMGAVLHQRGLPLLHASAVQLRSDTGMRTVLLLGEGATGKSLLAATFWRRGHAVLVDDLAVLGVDEASGAVIAQPEYPHLLLYPPALVHLGLSVAGYERVRPTIEKRRVPLHSDHVTQAASIDSVYLLTRETRNQISIEALTGLGAFQRLGNSVYQVPMLRGLGDDGRMLRLAPRLVRQARVRRLHYRIAHDKPSAIADAIEADLTQARIE
jgi:hypothetical protein